MRTVSTGFAAHLAEPVKTLAMCFLLTRPDGTQYGFTNHDQTLTFDGVDYLAHTGFIPTAMEVSDNLAVDNLDIEALFSDERLTDAEIRAGLFDYSTVEYFQVNWRDLSPTMGRNLLKVGTIGEITRHRRVFVAEVRGPSQHMQQVVGEVLTPTCRAQLGDARCKVDLPAITVTGTVTFVDTKLRRMFADSARTEADGLFNYGLLTWTTGANANVKMEVKTFTVGGTFDLFLEVPAPIEVGDQYSVYPGCDKLWNTCHVKFDNIVNFRGEPYLVGKDELFKFGGQ